MKSYLTTVLLLSLGLGANCLVKRLINSGVNAFLKDCGVDDDPESCLKALQTYIRTKCDKSQQSYLLAKLKAHDCQKLEGLVEVWKRDFEDQCHYHDYREWIGKVDRYVGKRYRENDVAVNSLTSIQKLTRHFAVKHAIQCQKRYVSYLRRLYPDKGYTEDIEETMERMKAIMTSYSLSTGKWKNCEHFTDDRMRFVCQVQSIKALDHKKFAIAARNYLKSKLDNSRGYLSKLDKVVDEEKSRLRVYAEDLSNVLNTWLYTPCTRLSVHLAVSVRPASYDFDLLDPQSDWLVDDLDLVYLYYHIAQFNICVRVSEQDQAYITKSMIEVIKRS